MLITRLLGVLLVAVTTGLLAAPAATAEPPFRLADQVTDNANVLTAPQRAEV